MVACRAQSDASLGRVLNFEAAPTGNAPTGWGGGNATVSIDDQIVHGGQRAVRIERRAGAAGAFGGITKMIPIDFAGTSIELRGFLRSEDVSEYVGMWMRVDGADHGSLGFATTQGLQIKGTTEWKSYSIRVPVHKEGRELYFGVFVAGTGEAWADDLELLVDGKPVWEVPKVEHPKTVIDNDHEFDAGSKISLTSLTPVQIENLATLGKVWGFLKYHHPLITAGQRHWDYELFRVMPAILAAPDRAVGNAALAKWIDGLGEIAKCSPCAVLKTDDLHLKPAVEWIGDK
ncbi:MAG: peptidase, partial [Candidatus Solibacter sp.]|nr:peptidase [Candidatus Solibacter sp.]